MNIVVNGSAREVPEPFSVADLIRALELAAQPVAVEVNREVVPRQQYPSHTLRSGDSVEIVTLVGGG